MTARHDPADKYAACGRVLLVGELNPYGADPFYALWDEPDEASGNRLRLILGLARPTYRALRRANLCSRYWTMPEARRRAALLTAPEPSRPWDAVVMLGAKVARAFGHAGGFFEVTRPREAPGLQGKPEPTLVSLPHPSGRNPMWNDPAARHRARAILRELAPGVPWGEVA